MKTKQNVGNTSRRRPFIKRIMFLTASALIFSFNANAQCVQNLKNSIDCCDFKIEVYDNGTYIGLIGQATPAICSDGCNVPPGTTSVPYTGTIQLNGDAACGPAQSMATYCTNNPGAIISFKIIQLAGSAPSWSVNVPTN